MSARTRVKFEKLPNAVDLEKKLNAGGIKAYLAWQVALPGTRRVKTRHSKRFEFITVDYTPDLPARLGRRRSTEAAAQN